MTTTALIFYDQESNPVRMGDAIGAGGEGTVYFVAGEPGSVAKVWHEDQRSTSTQAKIRVMTQNVPAISPVPGEPHAQRAPYVCWPSRILYDASRNIVGYVMPKLDPKQHHDAFHFFNPAARERLQQNTSRDEITQVTLFTIARNLANAVAALHSRGYVIGDINEKNILVNSHHDVTIVDADSFQVQHPSHNHVFRCLKGRDDYTPPRLQGSRYADHDRTPDDDAFGLAVVIFKLIMHGVHPYASTSDPDAATTVSLADKIRHQYFPYNESGHTPAQHRPSATYQQAWQDLDFDIRHLFRRAFDPQATRGRNRPEPREWVETLNHLIANPPPPPRPPVAPQPASRRRQQRNSNRDNRPAFGQGARNAPTATNQPAPQTAAPAAPAAPAAATAAATAAVQPTTAPTIQQSVAITMVVILAIAATIGIALLAVAMTRGDEPEEITRPRPVPTRVVIPTPTLTNVEYEQQFHDPDLQVDFDLWVDFEDTPEATPQP